MIKYDLLVDHKLALLFDILKVIIMSIKATYRMKYGSSEWMLLRSGKTVRPVLKIPLNIGRNTVFTV